MLSIKTKRVFKPCKREKIAQRKRKFSRSGGGGEIMAIWKLGSQKVEGVGTWPGSCGKSRFECILSSPFWSVSVGELQMDNYITHKHRGQRDSLSGRE